MMTGGITFGQYVPGDSLMHRLDPRTKVAAVLVAGMSVLTAANWQGLLAAAALVLLAAVLSRLPAAVFLGGLRSLWFLLSLAFLIQLLFTPGEILLGLGFLQVTREGLAAGTQIFARLAMLIVAAFLLTLTTSPISLTAGLESILSPLKRLGVPAHELAMMMTISLAFVPIMLQEAHKLVKAQRSRGAAFARGGPAGWAKSMLPLFVPLFTGALRRAEDLAVAMEARCYMGGANRTRLKALRLDKADYLALAAAMAVFAGVIGLRG